MERDRSIAPRTATDLATGMGRICGIWDIERRQSTMLLQVIVQGYKSLVDVEVHLKLRRKGAVVDN